MGRFFQTANASYVDDKMYLPPWELMQNVILQKEQLADDFFNNTEAVQGVVDTIQHLNFEGDNNRAKQLQAGYTQEIDELSEQMRGDVLNYQKYMPQLKSLQKKMFTDKTSGEWFQVEQRYQDYKAWAENNADMKESNPDLFNRLNQHWYQDVVSRTNKDSSAKFRGQKIISRPDVIEGYRQHFENIKANATEVSDGKYKISNKWLSEEEVSSIAWNTLTSDKDYRGYVNQMGNVLGDKGFFNDDGSAVGAFRYVSEDGEVVSQKEVLSMSAEDRKKVSKVLNPNNAFHSDLASVAQTYGFSERTVEEDKYGLQGNKATIDSNMLLQRQSGQEILDKNKGVDARKLEALRSANKAALDKDRREGKMEELERKYELMGERDRANYKEDLKIAKAKGDVDASKTLDTIVAKETVGIFKNPQASFQDDTQLITNNTKPIDNVDSKGTYFTAPPGTVAYAALQRRKNANTFAKNKLEKATVTFQNGDSFDGNLYFDWLGDREHSEELAKDFLENRMGLISGDSSQSTSQQHGESVRWTPGWLKSEFGKDWDAVYELGKTYEKERKQWYDNYNNEDNEAALNAVTDTQVNQEIASEIRKNPERFNVIDKQGNTPRNFSNVLSKIDKTSQVYVMPSNSHNEMGFRVEIDNKDYYIFPNEKNASQTNLMIGLSIKGVEKDSQYFKEMSNRVSSKLLHDMSSTGKNSKGTKSIITELNGREISLELVGDEVHLRTPDQGIGTPPVKTYNNMQTFVNNYFKIN